MSDQSDPAGKPDLTTPAGFLHLLLRCSANGVWFITFDDGRYYPLPRWMWAAAAKSCPNPTPLEGPNAVRE